MLKLPSFTGGSRSVQFPLQAISSYYGKMEVTLSTLKETRTVSYDLTQGRSGIVFLPECEDNGELKVDFYPKGASKDKVCRVEVYQIKNRVITDVNSLGLGSTHLITVGFAGDDHDQFMDH